MSSESIFISDLHLAAHSPEVVERFLDFCARRARQAERLYILGDLFDAYIGDDNRAWPFSAIRQALKELTQSGTATFLQQGNRDFLIGKQFALDTGVNLLGDYAVIDLHGVPTLLTHGDLLCTDDIQYQTARARIRTPEWQADALAKPLWLRKAYARWYRYKSGRDKSGKSMMIMDVNPDAVIKIMEDFRVSRLIHGHTHRPDRHEFQVNGTEAERFVLPQWAGNEWLLCFDAEGYRREPLI